jgi:hypothetical protein
LKGEDGEMKHRNFYNNRYAVAGVIEALLLVALVAIILSFIQLYYVPEIMKDREADHMDQVSNQFSYLKSVIETQSTMGIINEESANPKYTAYTSSSSPITMGSRELPYFISQRSSGQISIIDQDFTESYRINIQPAPADFPAGIPLTSIKYEAYNYYYLDAGKIIYALEGGGIILKQTDGEVMRVFPAMNIVNYSNDIEINWDIPLFNGIPGKNITAGYKESYIRTNYTTYYEHQGTANFVQIYTDYPDAWKHALINTSRGLLWEYHENGYLNVQIDKTTTPDRVIITPGTKNLDLKLTIIEIGTQVGAGAVVS